MEKSRKSSLPENKKMTVNGNKLKPGNLAPAKSAPKTSPDPDKRRKEEKHKKKRKSKEGKKDKEERRAMKQMERERRRTQERVELLKRMSSTSSIFGTENQNVFEVRHDD